MGRGVGRRGGTGRVREVQLLLVDVFGLYRQVLVDPQLYGECPKQRNVWSLQFVCWLLLCARVATWFAGKCGATLLGLLGGSSLL